MNALIVEDEEGVANLWGRNLEALGFQYTIAKNLEDAIRLSGVIPVPDLILLDLRLPGSDRHNTVNHISDLKKGNPDALVLVISGALTDELTALAIKNGAAAVKEKLGVTRLAEMGSMLLDAISKAPPTVKERMQFASSLIQKLTSAMALVL